MEIFLNAILILFIAVVFVTNIWLIVVFFVIRNRSVIFLNDSKKENFIKTRRLLKSVKSILAITIIIDCFSIYRLLNWLGYGWTDWLSALQICFFAMHLIIGIPMLKTANKAERLYIHLYPPIPEAGLTLNKKDARTADDDWDRWFNGGEEYKTTNKVNQSLDIMGEPDQELIKYIDGSYSYERNVDNGTTPSEVGSDLKECCFCGSLNARKNTVCDFCGAEFSDESSDECITDVTASDI